MIGEVNRASSATVEGISDVFAKKCKPTEGAASETRTCLSVKSTRLCRTHPATLLSTRMCIPLIFLSAQALTVIQTCMVKNNRLETRGSARARRARIVNFEEPKTDPAMGP